MIQTIGFKKQANGFTILIEVSLDQLDIDISDIVFDVSPEHWTHLSEHDSRVTLNKIFESKTIYSDCKSAYKEALKISRSVSYSVLNRPVIISTFDIANFDIISFIYNEGKRTVDGVFSRSFENTIITFDLSNFICPNIIVKTKSISLQEIKIFIEYFEEVYSCIMG